MFSYDHGLWCRKAGYTAGAAHSWLGQWFANTPLGPGPWACHKPCVHVTMMRGAMLMDMSSWKSSLQAYGMRIWDTWRHMKHTHWHQTRTLNNLKNCVHSKLYHYHLKYYENIKNRKLPGIRWLHLFSYSYLIVLLVIIIEDSIVKGNNFLLFSMKVIPLYLWTLNMQEQHQGSPGHTCVLFLHPRHSKVWLRRLAMAIRPHRLHRCTRYGSEASNSRSRRNWAAPWAIWQSRSISPNRRPPSLQQPSAPEWG